MAVIERYDKPFDRFVPHDHSKHLSVKVVDREDMHESVRADEDEDEDFEDSSEDETALVRNDDAQYESVASGARLILYWIFSLVGLSNPVFTIIAFFLGKGRVPDAVRYIVFVFSIVWWIVFVLIFVGIFG